MVCAITCPERIDALGALLHEVSGRLDVLLAAGRITTNFMVAERSSAATRYVPAYILDGIRNATTTNQFEDFSPRNERLVSRLISHLEQHVREADVSELRALQIAVTTPPRSSSEHRDEARALYLDRMLLIGSALLTELALHGLVDDIGSLQQRSHRQRKEAAPDLRYGPAKAITQKAAQMLRSRGLEREARSVELFEEMYIDDRHAA